MDAPATYVPTAEPKLAKKKIIRTRTTRFFHYFFIDPMSSRRDSKSFTLGLLR